MGPDLLVLKAVEPYDIARTPDLHVLEAEGLCDAAEPGPSRPDRSDLQLLEAVELCDTDEASSNLPKVGLYSDTDIGQPTQG